MAFKKGESGNIKGKPKGSQNKIVGEAKTLFVFTLEKQVPNLEKAFAEVFKNDKVKYLELFAKYAQYFVPRKTESDVSLKDGPPNIPEPLKVYIIGPPIVDSEDKIID